jgi:hypothetical protein
MGLISQQQDNTWLRVIVSAQRDSVNLILSASRFPFEGKSLVRIVVDIPTTAKSVLDNERADYEETEVAQVKLPHRPGELARAASRLGENNININYVYCGIDPGTNAPLLFFGVEDATKAAKLLEQAAAAAGT